MIYDKIYCLIYAQFFAKSTEFPNFVALFHV